MELNSWQREIARFAARHGLRSGVAARLLDLTSELGEVSKAYLLASGYGQKPFRADAAWEEEMGDLLFSLLLLAEASGIELEEALRRVLAKYEARARDHGGIGSGD